MTPDQIKLILVAAIGATLVAAGAAAGWAINGWRLGERVQQLEKEKQHALDQGAVLASAVNTCSASIDAAKQSSDAAIGMTRQLLEQLQPFITRQGAAVKRLEDLLKAPTPSGFGCREAWQALEQIRKDMPAAGAGDQKAGSR